MFEIAAFFTVVRQVMLSPRSGKHVTCSLKHEAVKHVVEIPFRKVGTVITSEYREEGHDRRL